MSPRFRLGFLTHVEGKGEPATIYQETLTLFGAAERLGFDVGWVAEHHFSGRGTRWLPSLFPFLAAAAERTSTLRLGTSLVVMPFTPPLRIAEDAAVVDTLSGGRLELGLGSGSDQEEFQAFGVSIEERHQLATEGIQTIRRALQGEKLSEEGQILLPPAPTLVDRLWQSAVSEIGAGYVARNGAGLLLSRAAWTESRPTDEVQLPVAEAFRKAWCGVGPPRIGLSRGVYLAADRETARAELEAGLEEARRRDIARGRLPADASFDDQCRRLHLAYGSADDVVEELAADRVLPHATDLILQFSPMTPTLDRSLQMLEAIATRVAPALGWRPADSPAE